MIIFLNVPHFGAVFARAAADLARESEIEGLVVLSRNADPLERQVKVQLPRNVLVTGSFTAAEIRSLRQALGTLDTYIYCYRPADVWPVGATGLSHDDTWSVQALERQARHADVGFPVPGHTIEEFLSNTFADICYTGELVEPSPAFAAQYAEVARQLRELLPQAVLHHIGSSALGIKTKPILDMLLVVSPETVFETVVPVLHSLGFYWVDYPENGSRWYFRNGFPRKMHIHLVRGGSDEERVHLLFRDRLLADARLCLEYETLKMGLSHTYPNDRAAYGREKSAFIERVIGLAGGS